MNPDFDDIIKCQMEPPLTDRERALRDLFVKEFYFDRNPVAAARRVGFIEGFAEEYATRFMKESYVRRKMRQHEESLLNDSADALLEKRRMIEQQLIIEANYHGVGSSHAARVSALSKLAALYGMDKDPSKDLDEDNPGGVMVVPAMGSVDDWGSAASNQQQKLKESVKD